MIYDYEVDENGCWIWLGKISGRGYGSFPVGKMNYAAHRIYYEKAKGEIPEGLVLDHLCRNIKCVNPDHLEPVPARENTLRGVGPTAINARKTHCPKGHPYDDDNLKINRGRRHCKICDAAHKLNYSRTKRKKPPVPPERRSEIARNAAKNRWPKLAALAPEQDK
jgi:hypothetical protein